MSRAITSGLLSARTTCGRPARPMATTRALPRTLIGASPRFLMSSDMRVLPGCACVVSNLRRLPHHGAGDDDLLDLARPLIDPEQADIPVEALDGIVGDIAGAAMDLDRAVGDAADHLAGEELAAGGQCGDGLALLAPARGVQNHAARGIGLGPAVGEHGLDQLELGDGLAELTPLHGIAQA